MTFVAPAAKQAFVDLLQASPTLRSVHVQRGLPATLPTENSRVYVAGVISGTRATILNQGGFPQHSAGVRLETADIRVVIEALVYSGNDQNGSAVAEEELWRIAGAIDDLLTVTDELGGVVDASEFTISIESCNPTSDGWVARALGTLHVEKRV